MRGTKSDRFPSSLITHHSSLIAHRSSLITHHSSLITRHSSLFVNQHMRHPVLPHPPPIHAFRVERRREVAVAIEDDAAAVAHHRLEVLELVMDDLIARVLHAH